MPPPREDECPICFLKLPHPIECMYNACCGKVICLGCRYSLNREQCPFCNTPVFENDEELCDQLLKRIEKYDDPNAMCVLGSYYYIGRRGFLVNHSKAIELYRRGCELGFAAAHNCLGNSYFHGEAVEQDTKKAVHHWQIAAMMGIEIARQKLGAFEEEGGNIDRAMRHYMISAKSGCDESLGRVTEGFRTGAVTKDDFEKTASMYHAFKRETRSEQRDRAKIIGRGRV